jgi:hypothetical protein
MDAGKTKWKERFTSFVCMKDSNCCTQSFYKSKNEKPLVIDYESPNRWTRKTTRGEGVGLVRSDGQAKRVICRKRIRLARSVGGFSLATGC